MWSLIAKGLVGTAVLGIASSIFIPLNLVCAYTFFRPLIQAFSFKQFTIGGLPIALPVSTAAIVVAFIMYLQSRWKLVTGRDGAYLVVLALSLTSIGMTFDMRASFEGITKLINGWVLLLVTFNVVRTMDDIKRVIDVIILSSLIPLAFGFYQEITGHYGIVYDTFTLRVNSVFGVGNAYGIYLSLITVAIAIRLLITSSMRGRLLLLCILSMVLVSQILALNRGTWIALCLAVAIATARYWRRVNKTFITILILVVVFAFADTIRDRFEQLETGNQYTGHNTFEGRVIYWRKLLPLIQDKPVLGYGVGTSDELAKKLFGTRVHAHNDFVTMTLEIGVLGGIAYLVFLIRLCWYFFFRAPGSPLWRFNYPLLILVVYFLIISSVQNIIYNLVNFPLFMTLVALGLKLNQFAMRTHIQEVNDSA